MARFLFTGVGLATRGGHNWLEAFNIIAPNLAQAEGWAYDWLRRRFPPEQGFLVTLKLYEMRRSLVESWAAAYGEDDAESEIQSRGPNPLYQLSPTPGQGPADAAPGGDR